MTKNNQKVIGWIILWAITRVRSGNPTDQTKPLWQKNWCNEKIKCGSFWQKTRRRNTVYAKCPFMPTFQTWIFLIAFRHDLQCFPMCRTRAARKAAPSMQIPNLNRYFSWSKCRKNIFFVLYYHAFQYGYYFHLKVRILTAAQPSRNK